MSLLGNSTNHRMEQTPDNRQEQFSLACELLRSGAAGEAYRIYTGLEQEQENIALLLNLSLCLMKAELWDLALDKLSRALSLLKQKPLQSTVPRDPVHTLLTERERDGDSYLAPIPGTAPDFAPAYTKETVLRLMVDCCAALGLWDRVQTLAGSLHAGHFGNVERALDTMRTAQNR